MREIEVCKLVITQPIKIPEIKPTEILKWKLEAMAIGHSLHFDFILTSYMSQLQSSNRTGF